MRYLVNGIITSRKQLVDLVLATVKEMPVEERPMMAKREIYPLEHNVKNHAYKIARHLGWEVITIPNNEIILEYKGLKGNASVEWIEENQYGVGHYAVLISVPYQNSKWENLFIFNRNDGKLAMQKAEERLRSALMRCTLC